MVKRDGENWWGDDECSRGIEGGKVKVNNCWEGVAGIDQRETLRV